MFQKILSRVARELKHASIPYMVIGGQAVLLYGEPRLTRDIDVTLRIGVSELARIKKVLPAMGLKVLVKNDREFVERTMVLPTNPRISLRLSPQSRCESILTVETMYKFEKNVWFFSFLINR